MRRPSINFVQPGTLLLVPPRLILLLRFAFPLPRLRLLFGRVFGLRVLLAVFALLVAAFFLAHDAFLQWNQMKAEPTFWNHHSLLPYARLYGAFITGGYLPDG